jgi:hypothetical protein
VQQAEAAEAEESSDDEGETKNFDGSNDVPDSSAIQVPSTQQPPQASIIEDLCDPSDGESQSQQRPPVSSMVEDLGDPSESEDEL